MSCLTQALIEVKNQIVIPHFDFQLLQINLECNICSKYCIAIRVHSASADKHSENLTFKLKYLCSKISTNSLILKVLISTSKPQMNRMEFSILSSRNSRPTSLTTLSTETDSLRLAFTWELLYLGFYIYL